LLGVGSAGGVESETDFDVLILEIAIDGFWTADHVGIAVILLKVLCQDTGIGVGIISPDDDESIQVQVFADQKGGLHLLRGFDLMSS